MTTFRFFLDWELNCQFAGLLWAREKGLYDAVGIDLDLVQPHVHPTETTLDLVRRYDSSLGCAEDNLVIKATLDGRDLRAVAAMLQTTPLALMALPESGIECFTDLAGRRVGVHADARHLLEALLTLNAVDASAVKIAVEGWKLGDLTAAKLDAVQGYVITERHALMSRGVTPRCLALRHERLDPCSQVIFTTVEAVRRDRNAVRAVLGASFAGWQAAMADPEEAAQVVAAHSDEHGDPLLNVQILRSMTPLLTAGRPWASMGRLRPRQWRRIAASA